MANTKLSSKTKVAVMTFFIFLVTVPLQAQAFIFLIPVIASKSGDDSESDKTMNGTETLNLLVSNTAKAEINEGTSYAYFKADGRASGIHPVHGRLDGSWNVDSEGETCLTWLYPRGSITNCSNVSDLGNGKYQWGNREFTLTKGDLKNLK
jgi:hypothetical protein